MQIAAFSELKASTSEYLAKVKSGEEILITDRGRPIAKIIPLRRTEDLLSARMMQLERSGMIKRGTGSVPEEFWADPRPHDRQGNALTAVLAEREDGR
ncbi:MAG: type II toxin-antitoxin system prevent-host-death family antitoxin [Geobacter sp.]|nr:type II toxin-antitoxin system prevent-host-death family antitoxin [Geobacter sp.]